MESKMEISMDEARKLYPGIRSDVLKSIYNYVEHGISPGGFLSAVLTNDLAGACMRADIENQITLNEIVRFVFNTVPSNCWGSSDAFHKHLEKKRSAMAQDKKGETTDERTRDV